MGILIGFNHGFVESSWEFSWAYLNGNISMMGYSWNMNGDTI